MTPLGAVNVGRGLDGKPFNLPDSARALHMHIIGASGRGKSKFLEYLIRSDIITNLRTNRGLCLIDPHGSLYDDMVAWCAQHEIGQKGSDPRKVILFEPGAEGWSFGFNPTRNAREQYAFAAETMANVCAVVWSENPDVTPRLQRLLRALFYLIAEHKLTLYEARDLVRRKDPDGIRAMLATSLDDELYRAEWQEIVEIASNERLFAERTESVANRLMKFLSSPAVRHTLGQGNRTIDFSAAMEEGHIVLVNLSPQGEALSEESARLIGSLMVNDLYVKARSRKQGAKPFYLYLDECYQFINEDIGKILDQTRKFGLYLTLAHQNLGQLGKPDEPIYKSVMAGAQTKVVFGGLGVDDAMALAKELYTFNPDLMKRSSVRPMVVGYTREWFLSSSESDSETESDSWGRTDTQANVSGFGKGTASGEATAQPFVSGPAYFDPLTGTHIESTQQFETMAKSGVFGTSASTSGASGRSRASSRGGHEALMPRMEERPTETYSLEEQNYMAMAILRNQRSRLCVVKPPEGSAVPIQTPPIARAVSRPKDIPGYRLTNFQQSGVAQAVAATIHEIAERRSSLVRAALLMQRPPSDKPRGPTSSDDEFRE
jgi:hypothetical protein